MFRLEPRKVFHLAESCNKHWQVDVLSVNKDVKLSETEAQKVKYKETQNPTQNPRTLPIKKKNGTL